MMRQVNVMEKLLTMDILEAEAAANEPALAEVFAQMQRANEAIKADRVEIDRLKTETWAIASQTRSVLEQLEAAHSC